MASGTELVTIAFSADASEFLFAESEGNVPRVYVIKTDGSGLKQTNWSGTNGGYGAPDPIGKGFFLGGTEKDLGKFSTWRISQDGSAISKVMDGCGAIWDASRDGKYLLTSLVDSGMSSAGISEYSLDDHKCTTLIPDVSTLIVHFSTDNKAILYLTASRGQTTIYRQPWHDGKLTGSAQPVVKLPFAFQQGFSGNGYDFSKDLSTVVYARPGGQADLYYLGQR